MQIISFKSQFCLFFTKTFFRTGAYVKRAKGRIDEAIKDLKEAVSIYKEVHDKANGHNFNVGFSYVELGELELDRNCPSEALRHFENALSQWKGIYGDSEVASNEWVATTYGFIARCHKTMGKDKLADEFKNKCIEMYERTRKK